MQTSGSSVPSPRAASADSEPASPWQNSYVESFGGRVRDELLAVERFSCLTEAQVLIEEWRIDDNERRPHSALQMMTTAAFAATVRQPLLEPTPTTAGEGIEERYRQTNPRSDPQPASSEPGQQQNPAEEITTTPSQGNSHNSYRGTTTTTTPLSRDLDR